MVIIAAYHLGQEIEATGTEDEIDYLVELGDFLSCFQQAFAGDANANHASHREAKLDWIGHSYDLYYMCIDQVRDALADAGLRNTEIGGNFRKWPPPILLERFNDTLIDLVYCVFCCL